MKSRIFTFYKKFEENKIIKAIRLGMVYAIPVLLIGSSVLVIKYFPIPQYQEWITTVLDGKIGNALDIVYDVTFNILSVILTMTVSYAYSKIISENGRGDITYSILALICLLITVGFQSEGYTLESIGCQGVFYAIVTAIATAILYTIFRKIVNSRKHKNIISYDGSFNEILGKIVPITMVVSIFALLSLILSFVNITNIHTTFSDLFVSLFANMKNNFWEGFLYVFLVSFLWFFGIHGGNALEAVALREFSDVGNIFSKTFNDTFVIIGGCGSILCLLIAILIFVRSKTIRNNMKRSIPFACFNISELAFFGIPVVLNPLLFIPFILTPIVLYCFTYFVIAVGIIPPVVAEVYWTTPVLISGYLATSSVLGTVLQIFNLLIGVGIYSFFIRLHEKMLNYGYSERVKSLTFELEKRQDLGEQYNVLNTETDHLVQMIAADVYEAFYNNEFAIYYQPQVDKDGKCIGAEALLRYNHPICGFIAPPLIIELATEMKYAQELEKFIIEEVFKERKRLADDLVISFNLTATALCREDIITIIDQAQEKYQVSPQSVAIEITEQAPVASQTASIVIKKLQAKGYKIILDDFGMGHTSLLYMQKFKFSQVKLTGDLVRNARDNESVANIITSVVELGKQLDFTITAEFVEDEELMKQLVDLGCAHFQGYHFAKPLPIEQFIEWCSNSKKGD